MATPRSSLGGASASEALRQHTRDVHRRVESCALLTRVVSGAESRSDGERLLCGLWVAYRHLEPALVSALARWAPEHPYAPRLALLEADLAALALPLPTRGAPLPDRLRLQDWPSTLGALYVVEGSALGSKHLRRGLRGVFGAWTPSALDPYGDRTATHWAGTRALIDDAVESGEAPLSPLIAAARASFAHIEGGLRGA